MSTLQTGNSITWPGGAGRDRVDGDLNSSGCVAEGTLVAASTSRSIAGRHARLLIAVLVTTTLALIALTFHLRLSLASSVPWQCDEIPLLVRFTGLCGRATNEFEARQFKPSFYSFRTGAVRSVHVPNYASSLHTTTGFWTNLGLHLFGYGGAAGRAGALFWSTVAVAAVGWAAWLAMKDRVAVCLAMILATLSPMITAYGAQARGYAESIAAAMLFLIALELLRRKSESLGRSLFVFLSGLQLSLTVYTAWVYVVLPVMLCCTVLLPRYARRSTESRQLRTILGVETAALIIVMAIYTIDRWRQFGSVSGSFGIPIGNWASAGSFVADFMRLATPFGLCVIPLMLVGVGALNRTNLAWWLWPIALSVVVPTLFCVATYSPGYVRNFTYLVGPLTLLAACGVVAILKRSSQYLAPRMAVCTGISSLLLLTGYAYAGLERRARDVILPDWGALVQHFESQPERFGPRFIAPDLANHWQINWYAPGQVDRLVAAGPTESIELVVGIQRDETDRRVVFQRDPQRGGIREANVPEVLCRIPTTEERFGIELRRFVGTPVDSALLESIVAQDDDPVLITALLTSKPTAEQRNRFLLAHGVRWTELIEYAELNTELRLVQSLIAPIGSAASIRRAMIDHLNAKPDGVAVYQLRAIK